VCCRTENPKSITDTLILGNEPACSEELLYKIPSQPNKCYSSILKRDGIDHPSITDSTCAAIPRINEVHVDGGQPAFVWVPVALLFPTPIEMVLDVA
jgi:hypothetical protein